MARCHVIKVRLNDQELEALDRMVAKRGTTRSETMRRMLRLNDSTEWALEEHAGTFRKLAEV